MKKVKVIFGLLVLGAIVIIVTQNLDFFLHRYAIGIDIGLVSYHAPNLATVIYLLFFSSQVFYSLCSWGFQKDSVQEKLYGN